MARANWTGHRDRETRLAKPLDTLERINRNEDMRRLRELAREQGVGQIIVGCHSDWMARTARWPRKLAICGAGTQADWRAGRNGGRALTSWEAERLLEEQGGRIFESAGARDKRQRRGKTAAQA